MQLSDLLKINDVVRGVALRVRRQRIAVQRHHRALDPRAVTEPLPRGARGHAGTQRRLTTRDGEKDVVAAALQRYADADKARDELIGIDTYLRRAKFFPTPDDEKPNDDPAWRESQRVLDQHLSDTQRAGRKQRERDAMQ